MKKIKLSNSEIRLLLLFLALLMFACAYFLSFQRNVARAEEIEAQNEEDRAFVRMLESMIARRPQIEAETEEYRQIIADIIAKYPPEVPTEKAITIVQTLESRTGVSVSSISFSMGNQVVSLAEYGLTADQTGSGSGASIGYRDTLGMTYRAEYSDFKEMISYIGGLTDRTTIPSITAAFDSETGNVSGVITVNMFYLTNTGKEYEEPYITGIRKGVSNIFRSGE